MQDCLFCKIAQKQIPAKIFYEDEQVLAFHDINPQAPTHILIIPKKHIAAISDVAEGDINAAGYLLFVAKNIAKKLKIDKTGFRLVINNGPDAGQAVAHLHVHLLGGRPMHWPPG